MFATFLFLSSQLMLAASLFSVRRIVGQLSRSPLRRSWNILSMLIVAFITGNLAYQLLFWRPVAGGEWSDLVVPVTFFFGASFVWIACALSMHTAIDSRRLALLEQENITDPLTGIHNRRYMERRLSSEFARARRHSTDLSVLLLDIDFFKWVNDIHGHQAGDTVLQRMGQLIADAVREDDIAARYGGEEMVIITPQTSGDAAVELAERLRQRIEAEELELVSGQNQKKTLHITASIGIASLNDDIHDAGELVKNADKALYRAKQDGRNQVVRHSQDLDEAPAEPVRILRSSL